MSKQVLLIAKAFPPNLGGIENYSEEVAFAYQRMGWDVTVVTQFNGEKGWSDRSGIRVLNVGAGSQWQVALRMRKAISELKSKNYDLVHATTWRVALPVLLTRTQSELVVTVHGREVLFSPWPVSVLMRWVFSRADRILVISQSTLTSCQSVLPILSDKAVISWNGISTKADFVKTSHAEDPIRLLTSCRLVNRKNITSALKAIKLLQEQGCRKLTYTVTGDGELRSSLIAEAEQLGLTDCVKFVGRVPLEELVAYHQKADVFLHPQVHSADGRDIEGFGLAVADAMSYGIATIAGKDGGPGEIIIDGETGILVDGSPGSIAAAIKKLVDSPATCERIGSNAKKWTQANLSWEKHLTRDK